DTVVLVAVRRGGIHLGGFAEVGTRPYADGCKSSPVAYLEGWYVDADLRRQGVGAELILAAEAWARSRGLTEFASDALLENTSPPRAYAAVGLLEVGRAVRYRKELSSAVGATVAVNPVPGDAPCKRRSGQTVVSGLSALHLCSARFSCRAAASRPPRPKAIAAASAPPTTTAPKARLTMESAIPM